MKTENELNAALSKYFRSKMPKLHPVKVADKVTLGVSDFLLFCAFTSVGLEVKFVKELPMRDTSKVLTHEFSGAQLTFLESIELTGNRGYGLIGVREWDQMILIPQENMQANFTLKELKNASTIGKVFKLGQYKELTEYLFPSLT